MKQLVIISICCCLVMLTGCQSNKRTVQVTIENGDKFPQFLVGKWKANKAGWEINFNADGSISEAVISMANTRIRPGVTTTIPMKMGGKSVFKPGQWLVDYDYTSQELMVTIVINYLYMEMGTNTLEGDITDIFTGQVSKDGNYWQVTDTTFSNLTGHFPNKPDFDFSTDKIYGKSQQMVFTKIKEKED